MRRESSGKPKLLITGASGLLGSNLAYFFKDIYSVAGTYWTHPVTLPGIITQRLDIVSLKDVRAFLDDFLPDIVIHCAAMTNVDLCEKNPDLAKTINILGTKNISDSLAGRPAKLVYISTDAVYDGHKGFFKEADRVNPLNVYGETKHGGELEALKRQASLVLRTNFFGWNVQKTLGLGEWMVDCLRNQKPFPGFRDVYFSSIYTLKLAPLIHAAIAQDLSGVYNCASRDFLSKYDFAVALARRFNLNASLIESVSIETARLKAPRGRNLSLDCGKLSLALSTPLPSISASIEEFYRDYTTGWPEVLKKCGQSLPER